MKIGYNRAPNKMHMFSFLIPTSSQNPVNPFSAGTVFMLMQTGWIQASRRVTRQLAWDPTCLPLSLSFTIKNKQNFKILKSRRQYMYNLFLENYPAFKGLMWSVENAKIWSSLLISPSTWHQHNITYNLSKTPVRYRLSKHYSMIKKLEPSSKVINS